MLRDSMIEESTITWPSLILIVSKPDSSLCLGNDFWKLNKVSEFNGYPMSWVDKLLKWLERTLLICTFDFTKGYWQVSLAPSS